MIKRLRPRYYCEHCRKSGGSSYHMRRHEEGCTANPNRKCRMCEIAESDQQSIAKLMACLPDPQAIALGDEWPGTECYEAPKNLAEGMTVLRELCNNCPACIAAALRQKHIDWEWAGFDFGAECKSFWDDINAAKAEYTYYG